MENLFKYESQELRTVLDESGNPWFAGIDICKILEYKNEKQVIDKLPDQTKKLDYVFDRSGQKRKAWIINESGLNLLILRSNMPKAEPFQLWVTAEVLPQIRKTGSYVLPSDHDRELRLKLRSDRVVAAQEHVEDLKQQLSKAKKSLESCSYELLAEVRRDTSQLTIPGT